MSAHLLEAAASARPMDRMFCAAVADALTLCECQEKEKGEEEAIKRLKQAKQAFYPGYHLQVYVTFSPFAS